MDIGELGSHGSRGLVVGTLAALLGCLLASPSKAAQPIAEGGEQVIGRRPPFIYVDGAAVATAADGSYLVARRQDDAVLVRAFHASSRADVKAF